MMILMTLILSYYSVIISHQFQNEKSIAMSQGLYPAVRLRRLRHSKVIRDLVRETHLNVKDLVMPIFLKHGKGIKNPISSMPTQYQISLDQLEEEIKTTISLGITNVLLFGIPEHKDPLGQDSYSDNGIVQSAIRIIKQLAPELLVTSDICFCEYTDHGHCGVITNDGYLDNDKTLDLLVKQAVSHAKAGTDIIAPSGMIDGMVQAIRQGLDQAGYSHLPIMSYSVKYSSALYGPFRQAAEGAPAFGDRSTHFMDIANANEALRECELDIAEGADMLMVKPAHAYLDIITRVKQAYPALPLGAYHTSAEFAMIKAAAQNGWINERNVTLEILTAMRRAGADFIVTYYAKEAAAWLNESSI
jgi:porphobilinogen synthase